MALITRINTAITVKIIKGQEGNSNVMDKFFIADYNDYNNFLNRVLAGGVQYPLPTFVFL